MPRTLTNLELEILRKLVNGEAASPSSHLRLRLEFAGAIRDGARGIVVTAEGRRLASEKGAATPAEGPPSDSQVARDSRGRRMPFQRKSNF